MDKPIARSWDFQSDSNPNKTYQTLQYTDGSTSCDCMGWTRHCKNGYRSCKHTRFVDHGMADRQAMSIVSHGLSIREKAPTVQEQFTKVKARRILT